MKKLLIVLAAVLLVGCDYTVPLVKTPRIEIDKSLLGLWQGPTENGKTEQLLVLPLSKNEYLVSYPSASKDGLFARACLCHTDNRTLVQFKWFGTAEGNLPDDNRVYQFFSYSISGDKLTVRQLNTDVVSRDVASTKDLAKAIAANRDNPKLFTEAAVFTKISK